MEIVLTKEISIIRPDDWHVHLREGPILKEVLFHTAKNFARALIMPNLNKPLVSCKMVNAYRNSIVKNLPKNANFEPLMTLYLTEETNPMEIVNWPEPDLITAIKYYPAGATTNSSYGIKQFERSMPILEQMAKNNIPLCIHGELPDEEYDIFDREKLFIDKVLDKIRHRLPELKITLEHITTKDAIDYIKSAKKNIAATITVHHLKINRNHLLSKGIHPHYYCLPVAKRKLHQLELIKAATSGNPRFFLGTDSAPHFASQKESACGCAGIFSSPYALPLLADIFEKENNLSNLEKFVSRNGALHYNLPLNCDKIILKKGSNPVKLKSFIKSGNEKVVIFGSEYDLYWTT